MSSFGKNVKKIRGVKKMSQQVFADLFDLKRATLGAYEEGRSEPKIDTIIKVANYFSITIDDMLTKEITINQLLSFDEGITTDMNHMVKASFVDVPYVNEFNIGLFIPEFINTNSYQSLPKITVPFHEEQNVLAFAVQDLMMVYKEEGLYPGDIVLGIQKNVNEIDSGKAVIAIVNHKIHVRRLYKQNKEFSLEADHVNIPPVLLQPEDSISFWEISAVLLNRYPNYVSNLEDRINSIDEKLKNITEK